MMAEKLDDYRPEEPSPAGGAGGTTDVRLRALEMQMVRLHEGFKRLEEALKRYGDELKRHDEEMKRHFATKAWILGGVLISVGIMATVTVAAAGVVVRLLSS